MSVEWAVAGRAIEGEATSGDAHTVRRFDGGVLLAVIDGLGHGPSATEAAHRAVEVLEEDPSSELLEQLRRCHARLKGTRGVVMSVARFDARRSELAWTGVGNVEGALLRVNPVTRPARHSLVVLGGVLGGSLPGLRGSTLSVAEGDVLIFGTDGVRPEFCDAVDLFAEPKAIAERALNVWGRGTDDALVLVARFSREQRERG